MELKILIINRMILSKQRKEEVIKKMRLHRKLGSALMAMAAVFSIAAFLPSFTVKAAGQHTITYKALDGSVIDTKSVTDGDSLGALPAQANLVAWVYDDCRMADSTTVPTADMTITAYHESECSAFGTLDGGHVHP